MIAQNQASEGKSRFPLPSRRGQTALEYLLIVVVMVTIVLVVIIWLQSTSTTITTTGANDSFRVRCSLTECDENSDCDPVCGVNKAICNKLGANQVGLCELT
jgi:uncharacterized protein (UPF0333 family)